MSPGVPCKSWCSAIFLENRIGGVRSRFLGSVHNKKRTRNPDTRTTCTAPYRTDNQTWSSPLTPTRIMHRSQDRQEMRRWDPPTKLYAFGEIVNKKCGELQHALRLISPSAANQTLCRKLRASTSAATTNINFLLNSSTFRTSPQTCSWHRFLLLGLGNGKQPLNYIPVLIYRRV